MLECAAAPLQPTCPQISYLNTKPLGKKKKKKEKKRVIPATNPHCDTQLGHDARHWGVYHRIEYICG